MASTHRGGGGGGVLRLAVSQFAHQRCLPWQIVPAKLRTMMPAGDAERTSRVMAELMKMVKLDIPKLEAACEGA